MITKMTLEELKLRGKKIFPSYDITWYNKVTEVVTYIPMCREGNLYFTLLRIETQSGESFIKELYCQVENFQRYGAIVDIELIEFIEIV